MKQPNPENCPVMLFYKSFEDVINDVYKTNKATAADLYSAIVRYGLFGEEPQLTGIVATLWKAIFPTLKMGRERAKAGHKGGKASKRNNPNGRRGKAATAGTSETSETSDGSPIATPGAIPTLAELREYAKTNGLNVDAGDFYNYYASRNWECNGKPIKNIYALLKKWHTTPAQSPAQFTPNESGEVNVCGVIVKLGFEERIDAGGRRTYGNGSIEVPKDAPRRPACGYEWSEALNEWIYNCI